MSPQNIDIDPDINSLAFDGRGLIPAIIQDAASGQVLMMAWMNKESLAISIKEGKTCFYSRSRKTLWRKGETSGNTQDIISITADCDKDTLLVKVRPAGPACHTGEVSCFFNGISKSEEETEEFSLDSLYSLLRNRKANPAEGSYTSYLFDKGEDKILKKVGEESTEVIIAAKNDRAELRYEIADLAYHLLVLMAAKDLTPAEIREELASRHIVDKKTKQEKMG